MARSCSALPKTITSLTEPARAIPDPVAHARRVAIVGGGAAGAILAIHLLHEPDPVDVTVFEPRGDLGFGLAYSTSAPEHRINVPAARMVVFAEDPEHFHRWLLESAAGEDDPAALAGQDAIYPHRRQFGLYLAALVAEAQCTSRSRLEARAKSADQVFQVPGGFEVDGVRLDAVVLATGNPPPRLPAALQSVVGHPRLITDATQPEALAGIAADDPVLIVGTALTMGDVVATLTARGHRGAITAVSRHGLVSRPGPVAPVPQHDVFEQRPTTALELLRSFRAAGQLHDWPVVVDSARRAAPGLWQNLAPTQQARAIRHLRTYWEALRFGMAPQVSALVTGAIARGQLTVIAARLLAVNKHEDGFAIHLRPRSGRDEHTIVARHVVNATGPAFAHAIPFNPLLQHLSVQGLIAPHVSGLGLVTDGQGRALGANGSEDGLYVVGPLARGFQGELSGIREISAHAKAVARHITTHSTFRSDPARGQQRSLA